MFLGFCESASLDSTQMAPFLRCLTVPSRINLSTFPDRSPPCTPPPNSAYPQNFPAPIHHQSPNIPVKCFSRGKARPSQAIITPGTQKDVTNLNRVCNRPIQSNGSLSVLLQGFVVVVWFIC